TSRGDPQICPSPVGGTAGPRSAIQSPGPVEACSSGISAGSGWNGGRLTTGVRGSGPTGNTWSEPRPSGRSEEFEGTTQNCRKPSQGCSGEPAGRDRYAQRHYSGPRLAVRSRGAAGNCHS